MLILHVTQTNQPYKLKNVLGYPPKYKSRIARKVFLSGKFAIKLQVISAAITVYLTFIKSED